jgi:hypothetical protein
MARMGKRRPESAATEVDKARYTCDTCGANVRDDGDYVRSLGIWQRAARVHHCDGKSFAFGAKSQLREVAHHFPYLHPACWKCGANLGCVRCSGPSYELLCLHCHNWGHPDAFNKHGRLLIDDEARAEALKFLKTITGGASQ